MASKSRNLLKPKPIKQLHSGKNANTANSLYSGIPSAQRAIQQQQQYVDEKILHFGSYIIFLVPLNHHRLGVLVN